VDERLALIQHTSALAWQSPNYTKGRASQWNSGEFPMSFEERDKYDTLE
jgi:hypothetical protein